MSPFKHDIFELGDSIERHIPSVAEPAISGYGIWALGLSDAAHAYSMARPNPPHAHLVVSYGGAGEVWHEGGWKPCGPGKAYLTPPKQPMAFRTGPNERWRIAWMYIFDSERLVKSLSNSMLIDIDPRQIVTAIEGLYVEASGCASAEKLELWAELVHSYVEDLFRSAGTPDPLWKLWAEVDSTLGEDWTLSRLADHADMQPEALRQLCIRYHGRSPMKHVAYLRMRRAEALLRTTSNKMASIARLVGYKNVSAFSTAYHRVKGRAPQTFRRQDANAEL